MCNDDTLSLINLETGAEYKWNHMMNGYPGELCFEGEFLVAAFDGQFQLATVHIPSILRSPDPQQRSTNPINLLSLSTAEGNDTTITELENAWDLWLLPPKSMTSLEDSSAIFHRAIEVGWLASQSSCRYSRIDLGPLPLTLDRISVENNRDSEAGTDGSPSSQGDSKHEDKFYNCETMKSLDISQSQDIKYFHRQRTVTYRRYLAMIDRFENRVHMLGIDKPGVSRPLYFPPQCADADPEAVDEETGVIICKTFDKDEGYYVLWFA
ncbi:hypothetical protein FRC17_009277 [Serendipita sp. 399]|nr:hypothetical protein FRC17_009277 [Serendipita sp. 399]